YEEIFRDKLKKGIIEEIECDVDKCNFQDITMNNDLTIEIGRRRKAGWATFNTYRDVLTNKRLDTQIKARVFNTHVLPTLCMEVKHGAQDGERRLASTQRAMERKVCAVTLMHKTPASEIQKRTGVRDVIETIYDLKKMDRTRCSS
ncbi:hypothetical protein TELCIR_15601, partial [Teladorsagia circumcincta]